MPFKSEAQRRKFRQMVKEGKMSQNTLDAWEAETPAGPLPERTTWKELPKIPEGPKVKVRRAIKVPRS
jgi:hypothetical protein